MKRAGTFLTPPTTKKSMTDNTHSLPSVLSLITASSPTITAALADPNIPPNILALLKQQQIIISALQLLLQQQTAPVSAQQQMSMAISAADEKERLRSLVLQGLPEQPADMHPSERAAADERDAKSVLHRLGVESVPVTCYRMGMPFNPTQQGPRPRHIKIVMAASFHQHRVLGAWSKKRKIIQTGAWANVWLRPSLTAEQRKMEYEERKKKREARTMNVSDALGSIAAQMNANHEDANF